jgi:DMSO/TMAO reductase YedYZ molybdopterin-dependent catalytic subunit
VDFNRRIFLKGAGGTALNLIFVPTTGCESNEVIPKGIGAAFDFLTPVDPSLEGDPAQRPRDAFFLQWGAQGIPSLDWRYDDIPVVSADDWTLRIEGTVSQTLDLVFADLEAVAGQGQDVVLLNTLRCIFDTTEIPGLVGNALWRGVPLRSFLDQAGIDTQTTARVRYFGRDGFTNNLRLEDIFLPANVVDPVDPLLVFEMNGEPIPHVHGGPVRLLTPGRYGYKNVKWIARFVATDDDSEFGSYQEQFGFFDAGTIQPITKVTNPLTATEIPAGPFDVFGYAISGLAGVDRVEASVDGGPFEAATLVPLEDIRTSFPIIDGAIQVEAGSEYPYRGVWTLFTFPYDATPGEHTLRFRTVDRDGNEQPETDGDPTDGTTGYWTLRITVV